MITSLSENITIFHMIPFLFVHKKVGGFLKGAAKGVVKAVKGIPVVGQVVTVGEEAIKGAFNRSAGAATIQAKQEVAFQRQIQPQATAGLATGLGIGNLLANPLFIFGIGGIVIFMLFRRRN